MINNIPFPTILCVSGIDLFRRKFDGIDVCWPHYVGINLSGELYVGQCRVDFS